MSLRVGVLGGSGFVGVHLGIALRRRGDDVVDVSMRDPERAAKTTASCDVVVNLAGEPIGQRWTPEIKARIESTRTELPHRFLIELASLPSRPGAYVSASAVGFYGTSETATFSEESPAGDDFLAHVCARWEATAREAEALGMRVAIVRTGLALGKDGGALAKMLPAFRVGLGGRIGNGRQWYSWIHIDDLVGIYLAAVDGVDGVMNATAPHPVTNAQFTKTLGFVINRPTVLPTPIFALRRMLGEGANVAVYGQRVLPERTQRLGYTFNFDNIERALLNLLS